ncbi:type II secretion system protein F [Tersicoccus phoenicis]|uniref:Type II secretion system protein F n=1 Tax=Tersicoccus phoenicis TaxID=554083 RepID=A0A1R1LHU8_9MICC|nr:type II secretion system F family protein [Tersicoccus phoenicis]OMH27082.1 type II secretion system protein F [Tersicoccus phoenicis]
MSAVLGTALGIGLLLIWWSCWSRPAPRIPGRGSGRLRSMLLAAGIENVSPTALLATCAGAGALVFLVVFVLSSGATPIAACFGLFGGWSPLAVVRWRAHRRAASLRELWPDVVDHLRSAIRAGLSLAEALTQLGERGPEELRRFFRDFGADHRSGGQFEAALDRLKERLADPVADRIIEALRMTRDVGGSDLGRLLGTLSDFLRENSRTRSELEARQSWTVNAARLAVAAPWIVLLLMATRPEAVAAYNSAAGAAVLVGGLIVSIVCYRLMLRIGSLPPDERVLR